MGEEIDAAQFDAALPPATAPWTNVDCSDAAVEIGPETLTHEIGHVLGLDHSPIAAATMAANELAELAQRTLEADDVEGLCFLYPIGAAEGTCCVFNLGVEDPSTCTVVPHAAPTDISFEEVAGCSASGSLPSAALLLLAALRCRPRWRRRR